MLTEFVFVYKILTRFLNVTNMKFVSLHLFVSFSSLLPSHVVDLALGLNTTYGA